MKMHTNGVLYGTVTSELLQEYVIRQQRQHIVPGVTLRHFETIGFERLYETAAGSYWIHERFYRNAGGDQDTATPLTEADARAWLKDRFGWWKRFARLETRVFGANPR
jgi:hypothetical protein